MSSSEWQKFVDDDSGATYYYNARTGESSWSEPEGFVASAALKPPRWRRVTDESTDRVYYYDEANGVTQWEAPEGADVLDASDDDDEDEGDAGEGGGRDAEAPESAAVEDAVREDADGDKKSDERSRIELEEPKEEDEKEEDEKEKTPTVKEGKADSEDQETASKEPERSDDKQTETTTTVVTWVKHIDSASGKPYYHNPASNVTQWEEPAAFVDAPPLTAAALEYQAHVNRAQTERLARVTQRVLDPTGSLSRLNKILGGINPGGAVGAQSAADAPLDGLQDAAETTRRAEWQQHVDPHTHRFYYHNAVTGETQWHKPDAPIVSGLADWVPPDLSDPTQDASSHRTVSGVTYASTAQFNRVTGKFEPAGGVDAHWERRGIAGDRAGRQMSHFFDMTALEKNRADAKVIREKLKRQNVDWKKVAAEKKAKKAKQKNEWLYQD